MQSRQTKKHTVPAIATFLALLLGSISLHADRILVIGDSWAAPIGRQLRAVLTENGHTEIKVETRLFAHTAFDLSSPAGLDSISAWLDAWPDANIVHLSIGANDWFNTWTLDSAGTQAEASLFADIVGWVERAVDHIFSIRPDAQVMWSSYDFFRPINLAPPTEINRIHITLADLASKLALTRPGLSFVDLNGTLQVTYGFDGVKHSQFDPSFPIPPGDSSLPDPTLPSPIQPFRQGNASHLNNRGYKVLAQAQYDRFYGPLLNGQDFHINPAISDAWYDPATDGQGFFITVFPDLGVVSLAWFTYDTELPPMDATANLGDPGHRWLTAAGPFVDNQAVMNIVMTSDGLFDTATDVQRTDPPGSDGTLILTFDSCSSGTVEYDIPSIDRQGIVPIQRVAKDNIALCEALSAD